MESLLQTFEAALMLGCRLLSHHRLTSFTGVQACRTSYPRH